MKEDNNSMHRTRHLIQIVVSVLVMTMMGLTCHAENSQGQRPPFDPKRFEAELEQYITTHASLTPQEASKFFPVYRQMMKKMRSCFDEMRRYHFVNPADEKGCADSRYRMSWSLGPCLIHHGMERRVRMDSVRLHKREPC